MTEPRFRIFADSIPHGGGPPRPAPRDVVAELAPELPVVARDGLLAAVSRILDSEGEAGESVQRSFDRKERELRAFFDQLDPDDRTRTWARLVGGDGTDSLVMKLARLSAERRQRLVASLSEAPRRRAR